MKPWRAGTKTQFLRGFLAPIDCSKIPAENADGVQMFRRISFKEVQLFSSVRMGERERSRFQLLKLTYMEHGLLYSILDSYSIQEKTSTVLEFLINLLGLGTD
jgi:hypothetical protein